MSLPLRKHGLLPPMPPLVSPPLDEFTLRPPMHDTSFSEQYKSYQAVGGAKPGMADDVEMTQRLKSLVKTGQKNKTNMHRHFQRPPGFAEEFVAMH